MRVLVVDDDPKVRTFLDRGLGESGMVCTTMPDGESALAELDSRSYDVVLLDVMLPGLQGWDVMESLRSRGITVPVIWVTARDSLDDRIKGLQAGGDDYVVKPYAFAELVARIHAVVRRHRQRTITTIGELEIDHLKSSVRRAGSPIELSRNEFLLLSRLVAADGEPVSRTELLQSVWGIDFDPESNVVEVGIRRLRQRVDDPFETPLVHTIRGSGYALRP